MKKKYELDKILQLVEQRELLTTQLSSFETPEIIIPNENGNPLYKICMSLLGDLLIFVNRDEIGSMYGMISQIGSKDSLIDQMNIPCAMSYLEAARAKDNDREKSPRYQPPQPPRTGRWTNSSGDDEFFDPREERDSEALGAYKAGHWRLVFVAPATKCLDMIELIYKIFGDDLHNYKENT